jgi:hypothetical protein
MFDGAKEADLIGLDIPTIQFTLAPPHTLEAIHTIITYLRNFGFTPTFWKAD